MKERLLFVCSSNIDRSPATAELFANSEEYEVKSAGIHAHSKTVVSSELLSWAERIFVMEGWQKKHILTKFPETPRKRINVLGVPSYFQRNDPELIPFVLKQLTCFRIHP